MRRAYKFRLFTNCSQERALDAMLERHRRLYNLALRERRDVYEAEKRSVSYGEQSARYRESRRVLPGFAALNFSSAQATLRRLDKAFKAFFRRAHPKAAFGQLNSRPTAMDAGSKRTGGSTSSTSVTSRLSCIVL
jgi:transposase